MRITSLTSTPTEMPMFADSVAATGCTSALATNQSSRRGAALLEVLMALGVMAIGVLSIMTLFPLSVRKALEASQKTNASILKWQFEQLLATYPQILPINDRTVHVPGNNSENLFPLGTPVGTTRIRVVDPRGVFASATATNYDYNAITDVAPAAAFPAPLAAPKFRTHAGLYRNEVENFTTLRDSWTSDVEFVPTAGGANSVTVPATAIDAISAIPTAAPLDPRFRLLISDANGKQFQTRNFIRRTGSNLEFFTDRLATNPAGNLPAAFQNPLVCRLQQFESRYSWIVTTKTTLKGLGPDNVSGTVDDVVETDAMLVVFFRRNLSELAESLFTSTLAPSNNTMTVTPPAGVPIKVDAGSYVFDGENGEWYLVLTATPTGGNFALELDRKVEGTTPRSRLVIYENIMGAYPLGRFWTGL